VLKIRLRRTGAKKQPRYRVVVAESTAPRDGAFVEVLGWYNPQADPAQVVVDTDKAAQWIAKGAQPSDRVAYLLKQASAAQAEGTATEAAAAEAVAEKPAAKRATGKAKAAAEEASSTDSAPESEGSASVVTSPTSDTEPTSAPESEGSSGATPA
jgi:small subunit ribosomal protein S16